MVEAGWGVVLNLQVIRYVLSNVHNSRNNVLSIPVARHFLFIQNSL